MVQMPSWSHIGLKLINKGNPILPGSVVPDDVVLACCLEAGHLTWIRITPEQSVEGHVYRARSEGRACHARRNEMGHPTLRGGRDERVPPKS
jgi:hypothetical protein